MVKKMNATHAIKRTVAVLLAVIVLFTLSSCGTPEPENETASVKFSEFEKKLREQLAGAEGYEMSPYESTENSDGEKYHTFYITHNENKSELAVICNVETEITELVCKLEDGRRADIALISRYIYKSLNLSEMDSDTFYNTFAFFEETPADSYEKEENGWSLDVLYIEDKVFFHALKLPS